MGYITQIQGWNKYIFSWVPTCTIQDCSTLSYHRHYVYCIVLYCIMLYCIYCIVLWCVVLYCIVQTLKFIPWILDVENTSICQLQIFLSSRMPPCLLVLGYLIDCLRQFKVSERIVFVLKIIWFRTSWIIHFIQLLNFFSIQQTISVVFVKLYSVVFLDLCVFVCDMTSFMSTIYGLRNVKIYVCIYVRWEGAAVNLR
jgi:hypothetical protein